MSLEDVAARANMSGAQLSRLELGSRNLDLDVFIRLAEILDQRPGDLLPNSGALYPELRPVMQEIGALPPHTREKVLSLVRLAVGMREDGIFEARNTEPVSNVRAFPVAKEEHTAPRWTEEFPVDPADFIEKDFDYPLELHADEVEVYDVAAGVTGVNQEDDLSKGHVIHGEVRDPSHRVIKVVGDSMAPTFCSGWKLLVDCKKQAPENEEPVAVYIKDEGSIIGRWNRSGRRVQLLKDNDAFEPVELGDPSNWILLGTVQTIVHAPVPKRRKR